MPRSQPNLGLGHTLKPRVRQEFLGARVDPSSSCLELSGVDVFTALLTELLKGLDS